MLSGINLWMVAKTIPPLVRFSSSRECSPPLAVRYAWKDWPDYSLANGAGLPASPFRTDDWPVPALKK